MNVLSIIKKTQITTWTWRYWLFFIVIIPLINILMYFLIQTLSPAGLTQSPPYDIINQTFTLNTSNPTLLSMFFANFSHLKTEHMIFNIILYIVSLVVIFFIEDDKKRFVYSAAFFFLILPFLISILTVLFFRSVGGINMVSYGFSGICFAFIGYAMYALCRKTCEKDLNLPEEKWNCFTLSQKRAFIGNIVLCDLIIVFCIPIFSIWSGLIKISGKSVISGVAHFIGFFFGVLLPLSIAILIQKKIKNFEMTVCILLIFSLGYFLMNLWYVGH